MTPREARLNHLANFLVGGTGVLWIWMRYFMEPLDEFAVINHPLEPSIAALHLITAPLLVFAVGLIWRIHAWEKYRSKSPIRRRTGILLYTLFIPLVASGYFLQIVEEEVSRSLWLATHLITGGAWILVYVGHQLLRKF